VNIKNGVCGFALGKDGVFLAELQIQNAADEGAVLDILQKIPAATFGNTR
jgi:hypothetical protein